MSKNRTYKLSVEINQNANIDKSFLGGRLVVTPPIGEDWWTLRVKVSAKQSILVFPKFGIFGCGFAKEIDWNTNLPIACQVGELWNHIKVNRAGVSEEKCLAALNLIREEAFKLGLYTKDLEARSR